MRWKWYKVKIQRNNNYAYSYIKEFLKIEIDF